MGVKECYRVLELEVGAPREAVEASYCRLLEKWHPDRVKPAGDVEGIAQANRMVAIINEAYQSLGKLASVPAPAPTSASVTRPPMAPLPVSRPTSAPTPPAPAPSRPAPAAAEPPAAPRPAAPPAAKPAPASPLQRYGVIAGAVAGLLILVLVAGKCTSKPSRNAPPDPKTTGTLTVKSNRPDATVEAIRAAGPDDKAPTNFRGNGAVSVLTGLPPGQYSLTAEAPGWPAVTKEFTVAVGQNTDAAMNFPSGSLKLDSFPDKAIVRRGEIELGKTPLVIPALPTGEIPLTLEYPSWPPYPFKATIADGAETAQFVRLPHGKLVVESTPTGATVQLEAKLIGQTPLTVDRLPAGVHKITLRLPDFTPVAFAVTVEDKGESKLAPVLVSSLPILDPATVLTDVWMEAAVEDPNRLAPGFRDTTGYQSRNGIVRNLNRKKLVENWLGKRHRFTGTVKSYDRDNGRIEFSDTNNEPARFRVVATLSIASRQNKDVVAQLTKGATIALYAKLDAVEEPRWPAKVISFELTLADPQ